MELNADIIKSSILSLVISLVFTYLTWTLPVISYANARNKPFAKWKAFLIAVISGMCHYFLFGMIMAIAAIYIDARFKIAYPHILAYAFFTMINTNILSDSEANKNSGVDTKVKLKQAPLKEETKNIPRTK